MKTSAYKLPNGVHEAFAPRQTGTTPDTQDKDGNVIKGKPIYEYTTVEIPEAENLAEFGAELVEQDDAERHVLTLAQGAYDILAQRVVREFLQSEEVFQLMEGKHEDTKHLEDADRRAYVLGLAQDIGKNFKKGGRAAGTGGQKAAATKALKKEAALQAAAAQDPRVAALLEQQAKLLAELGVQL